MTATTGTTGTPTESPRLHGLDALRAGALGLGIVIHSLMPFAPGGGWLFSDARTSEAAIGVVGWIHLFRMVLFMALAGYFGRMVLHRRGAGSYLRDRTRRILLPLLAFMPLALGSLIAVAALNAELRGLPTDTPPAPPGVPEWLLLLNPAHLWFLGILMECIVLTVLGRALLRRVFGPERISAAAARLGRVLAAPGGAVLALLPYFAALLLQGHPSSGIDQPVTIVPTVSALVGYLGAFVVGWCLHAYPGALRRIAGQWVGHLAVALVLTVVAYVVPEGSIPLPAHAALIAVAGWTWTLGLIGVTVRFLNRENAVVRYLADSSYWVYILHLPVVALLGVLLADAPLPIIVKLVITWAVSGVVLLLSYDLLVRGTWIGKWLNGRRRPSVLRSGRALQQAGV